MPKGAEQRALDKRSAWITRHLGDLTQTFSKMAITSADISSLLRSVEEDQTLVHAAYYTDDECIARIADWIAGKGDRPLTQSRMAKIFLGVFNIGPPLDPPFRFFAEELADRTRKS
jgi:hypothetical protein